jgi:hypothetical protein
MQDGSCQGLWEGRNRELVNGNRVSIFQGEKILLIYLTIMKRVLKSG